MTLPRRLPKPALVAAGAVLLALVLVLPFCTALNLVFGAGRAAGMVLCAALIGFALAGQLRPGFRAVAHRRGVWCMQWALRAVAVAFFAAAFVPLAC